MKVRLGVRDVDFPSEYLAELQDSSGLLSDVGALRERMNQDGYVFLKDFLERDDVLRARETVLKYLADVQANEHRQILDPTAPTTQGVLDSRCGRGCVPFMEGKNAITHEPSVLRVIESARMSKLFAEYFGTEARSFDYKWLRAMYNEGFTGAHVDNVYMARGSEKVITVWIPFGDESGKNTPEMGTLAVCEGSHRLPSFNRFQATYGECDLERENIVGTGWYTLDPFEITDQRAGAQWRTASFDVGDVLLFGLHTVHMSTVNLTPLARISCDSRWQPANERFDERYVGELKPPEAKYGNWAPETKGPTRRTIEEMKSVWGI